ncbi:TPA: hypothetical protein PNM72_002845 [Listeria monocytogenes]|uniref:Uncharacterized protein n=1 Tax=Listeria ivanovii subsp. londoniensis TaxID=202752 RepID=A0ABS1G7B4_LISIV|nr:MULTISPECIES: hypothetical protein [Listeria]EFS02333.1 conserved hypothetical protein [Listeria seeligeri FSL S4-171]EKE4572998.1 hypothetical protein [Listeria monocytogenes serotype 1/2a]EFT0751316.1 hypothetical protein [Listeria monocytogenes]EHJ8857025.1 hypothetical protein [Listeria monocytogenes]EHL2505983.1 hypothetical protein [Listeria monocytogenes]
MQLKKENVVYNTDDVVLINQLKIDGFEEFEYKEPEKEPSKSKKEPKNKEGE